ncbi:pyrroline-5-carboxylate reductase [Litchfieldia alkalitelluris]|uniref:pyrroline-5-carboxylate reductase n=1 Tax=Litchfieldia alkalitelluris TaxID=304268 RepID=UPI000998A60A|nr:pyrroline-5-carboxylate reductase [Litchfieldia alkalitelluris]
MKRTIGFIGSGKMAQSIIQGLIKSEVIFPNNIIVSAKTESTLIEMKNRFAVQTTLDNKEVSQKSDILFLAVKPNLHQFILNEIKQYINKDTIIITIAAGISIEMIEGFFLESVKVVRTMPNTPSLVGEGMTAICFNQEVSKEEEAEVAELFKGIGKVEFIEENMMNAIPAVSGSSPAYVYMFIEALADGAVLQGIPRQQALNLAAQAVLGAAKMVMDTGLHPAVLKDQVCTPGGATIEAVATLERNAFRAAIIDAMEECTKKSISLSKQ